MKAYEPQHFEPDWLEYGEEIWDFLTAPDTFRAIELAVRLGKPPVIVLDTLNPKNPDDRAVLKVLRRARENGRLDRVKQMSGHMAAQLMEDDSRHQKLDNKPIDSWLFGSATRYRERGTVRYIFVHRNRFDTESFLVSRARRPVVLPVDGGSSDWFLYRRCVRKHELEFVLDQSVSNEEWQTILRLRKTEYLSIRS